MVEHDDALLLMPSDTLPEGERLLLTVYFEDGAAPASANFELVVLNTGPTPWKTAHAALVDAQGRVLAVSEPWQSKPIELGQMGPIVFELEATEKEAQGPFLLELWPEEGEARSVTFGGVEFP